MDSRTRYPHGIDRARQALAEWRRGELQRQVPRRVSEPRMVSFARRSKDTDRRMATPLQRSAPSFEPRLPHAQRVRALNCRLRIALTKRHAVEHILRAETRLPGWACRTRTCESVRALSDWNSVTTSFEIGAARRWRRFAC